jgi:hypothetical protein
MLFPRHSPYISTPDPFKLLSLQPPDGVLPPGPKITNKIDLPQVPDYLKSLASDLIVTYQGYLAQPGYKVRFLSSSFSSFSFSSSFSSFFSVKQRASNSLTCEAGYRRHLHRRLP